MNFDAKRGIHVDWETADVLEWFLRYQKNKFIRNAKGFGHEQEEAENMYHKLLIKLQERLHS